MKMQIGIKNQSIETSGLPKDYRQAICEYVWNSLEANATEVDLAFVSNAMGGIDELSICDNGNGIDFDDLSNTFGTFLSSKKNSAHFSVKSKRNKGKGRFSFLVFASSAKWITTYRKGDTYREYEITIKNETKDTLEYSESKLSEKGHAGTVVKFLEIQNLTVEHMCTYLMEEVFLREFAWYLCLYKSKNIRVSINGSQIDYRKCIDTEFSETRIENLGDNIFTVELVVWNSLVNEKSYIYYLDSANTVIGRKPTAHNKNGMGFRHSVFVMSEFFDDIEEFSDLMERQQSLFVSETQKIIFEELEERVEELIQKNWNYIRIRQLKKRFMQ